MLTCLFSIIIAGVINGHVAAKYIYVRMFRGTGMMSQKSLKSYGTWALIGLVLWTVAWIIVRVALFIFSVLVYV